jgi:hypothetical protein
MNATANLTHRSRGLGSLNRDWMVRPTDKETLEKG